MKVSELIELLNKIDPENRVILSADEEGNSFSPLFSIEVGGYDAENREFLEDDEEGVPCVVCWPE